MKNEEKKIYAKKVIAEMGREAEVVEVCKANDQFLVGVNVFVSAGDRKAGQTLYINDFFSEGISPKECARSLIKDLEKAKPQLPELAKSIPEFSWEKCKDKLAVRLLHESRNSEYLKSHIYLEQECGFVFTVDIVDNDYRIAVTESILGKLGCSRYELLHTALENAAKKEKAILVSLADMYDKQMDLSLGTNWLEAEEGCCPEDETLLLLTNESAFMGASVFFLNNTQQRIYDIVGDYYVLPSSIHEIIIVPVSRHAQHEDLYETVLYANNTVVDPAEQLCTHVYRYNGKEHRLEEIA